MTQNKNFQYKNDQTKLNKTINNISNESSNQKDFSYLNSLIRQLCDEINMTDIYNGHSFLVSDMLLNDLHKEILNQTGLVISFHPKIIHEETILGKFETSIVELSGDKYGTIRYSVNSLDLDGRPINNAKKLLYVLEN